MYQLLYFTNMGSHILLTLIQQVLTVNSRTWHPCCLCLLTTIHHQRENAHWSVSLPTVVWDSTNQWTECVNLCKQVHIVGLQPNQNWFIMKDADRNPLTCGLPCIYFLACRIYLLPYTKRESEREGVCVGGVSFKSDWTHTSIRK
jgi:hypothetical protein